MQLYDGLAHTHVPHVLYTTLQHTLTQNIVQNKNHIHTLSYITILHTNVFIFYTAWWFIRRIDLSKARAARMTACSTNCILVCHRQKYCLWWITVELLYLTVELLYFCHLMWDTFNIIFHRNRNTKSITLLLCLIMLPNYVFILVICTNAIWGTCKW